MQKCIGSIPGRYSVNDRGTKIQSKRLVETVSFFKVCIVSRDQNLEVP